MTTNDDSRDDLFDCLGPIDGDRPDDTALNDSREVPLRTPTPVSDAHCKPPTASHLSPHRAGELLEHDKRLVHHEGVLENHARLLKHEREQRKARQAEEDLRWKKVQRDTEEIAETLRTMNSVITGNPGAGQQGLGQRFDELHTQFFQAHNLNGESPLVRQVLDNKKACSDNESALNTFVLSQSKLNAKTAGIALAVGSVVSIIVTLVAGNLSAPPEVIYVQPSQTSQTANPAIGPAPSPSVPVP